MILDRYDTQGLLVRGGMLVSEYVPRRADGAIYQLTIVADDGTPGARVFLNPEGCVAVAHALLDAAKWALPGGVEGCDDRHVREAAEALYDRAVIVEDIDATCDAEATS